jgi:hypothetical protein
MNETIKKIENLIGIKSSDLESILRVPFPYQIGIYLSQNGIHSGYAFYSEDFFASNPRTSLSGRTGSLHLDNYYFSLEECETIRKNIDIDELINCLSEIKEQRDKKNEIKNTPEITSTSTIEKIKFFNSIDMVIDFDSVEYIAFFDGGVSIARKNRQREFFDSLSNDTMLRLKEAYTNYLNNKYV